MRGLLTAIVCVGLIIAPMAAEAKGGRRGGGGHHSRSHSSSHHSSHSSHKASKPRSTVHLHYHASKASSAKSTPASYRTNTAYNEPSTSSSRGYAQPSSGPVTCFDGNGMPIKRPQQQAALPCPDAKGMPLPR